MEVKIVFATFLFYYCNQCFAPVLNNVNPVYFPYSSVKYYLCVLLILIQILHMMTIVKMKQCAFSDTINRWYDALLSNLLQTHTEACLSYEMCHMLLSVSHEMYIAYFKRSWIFTRTSGWLVLYTLYIMYFPFNSINDDNEYAAAINYIDKPFSLNNSDLIFHLFEMNDADDHNSPLCEKDPNLCFYNSIDFDLSHCNYYDEDGFIQIINKMSTINQLFS